MNPVRFSVTTALIFLALGGIYTGRVAAQDERPRHLSFELGLSGGVFIPDEEHEFYDPTITEQQPLNTVSPDFNIHLGFYPGSFIGIEGEGSGTFSETDGGGTANLYSVRGSLVLQIPFRVTPFILGGIGNTWLRSENTALGEDRDRVFHGGAGFKIFATRTFHFRVEGRVYYTNRLRDPDDPTDDNGYIPHFGALAGVGWTLGGRSTGEEADPDPDRDGFVSPEDQCPDQKGVEPDGCPSKDTDSDGLADSADRCPTEAETVNGHDDTDGCPDELPDSDGDDVTGERDKCPEEPEDKDGFQDDDGCPDADNDSDGLVDGSDNCPEQSGPTENRGCPDTDKDGDGVVDRSDNCPDEPGRSEYQGCRTKQLVSITPSQLRVFKNVQFGSSSSSIARRSRRLLDNVAAVIRSHPEFRKVRIEGHTDDRGSDDLNKQLSQQRAQAVADYLIGRGVEPDRLQAIGFGEEKPLFSNRTASGRRKNRRVEFNLEDVRPPGSSGGKSTPGTPTPAAGGDKKSGSKKGDTKLPEKKDEVEIKPPKKEGDSGGGD
jgi:outer membrane protein OmpA-like peptidoglycan-associated protein